MRYGRSSQNRNNKAADGPGEQTKHMGDSTMQIAQENAAIAPALGVAVPESSTPGHRPYSEYKIIRRNGAVVGFEPAKISVAITKAFLAVNGSQGAAPPRNRERGHGLTHAAAGAPHAPHAPGC